MKISDFVYEYTKTGQNRHSTLCRVRIFVNRRNQIGVVLTDLGDKNPSLSVTMVVEKLAEQLITQGYVENISILVEHYESDRYSAPSFDFVDVDKSGTDMWKRTNLDDVCAALDCKGEEFETKSLEVNHIFDQVEKLRHSMDPHIGEPYSESFELINRRNDILDRSIPIGDLQNLINNGSGERELHTAIKSDLSLLGEFYAHPTEEYICFSEFPIGQGYVDFVVFSGRSRMDVTLIEVKGANYNLINQNNYQDFSSKTNQAVQQIRSRLGYICKNHEEFRVFSHKIRAEAELNNRVYNSFIGPKTELLVDPDKDINLHTIVIGGRSKNDINESKLRHEYERTFSPSIRIESWDSWVQKHPRN